MTCISRLRSLARILAVALVVTVAFLALPDGAFASPGDTGSCGGSDWVDVGPWTAMTLSAPVAPSADTVGYEVTPDDLSSELCTTAGLGEWDINPSTGQHRNGNTTSAITGELWTFATTGDPQPDLPAGYTPPSSSPSPSPSASPSTSPTPSGSPSPPPTSSVAPSACGSSAVPCVVAVSLPEWEALMWMGGSSLLMGIAWFVYTFARRLARIG